MAPVTTIPGPVVAGQPVRLTRMSAASMVVESVAMAGAEPPPVAEAALISGDVALDAIETVTVMAGNEEPLASASERVQDGTTQAQPVPDMAVTVMPVGAVSVTVTRPLVAMPPLFDTVKV